MTAEAEDLVLYRFLKSIQYKKGNDHKEKPDGYADDRNRMDGRRKAFLLRFTNSA